MQWHSSCIQKPMSKPTTAPSHDSRNRSLQGLRGFAAALVLLFHVHAMGAKGGFWPVLDVTHWMHDVGPIAVRLFFFISGYLIVGSLWRNGDVRQFALNRVLRIYPVFLLLHLTMFTLGPLTGYEWVGGLAGDDMSRLLGDPVSWTAHFLSNLFFLPGILALPIAQQNAWSLSYEALFYVLAAIMFIAWRKRQQGGSSSLWFLGWAVILAFNLWDSDGWFFLAGVGVWWLQKEERLSTRAAGPLDILALLAGFWFFHNGWHIPAAIVLSLFFILVVRERGWMRHLLRSDTMNFVGLISYSLYLVHPFALEALRRVLHHGHANGQLVQHAAWFFWVIGPIFAVGCAWLSYEVIEKRFTRWVAAKLELRRRDLAAKSAPDLMATR